mgnify:CR=1 FL=1
MRWTVWLVAGCTVYGCGDSHEGARPDATDQGADASHDAIAVSDGRSGADGAPEAPRPGPRPVSSTPVAQGSLFAAPDGSGSACAEAAPCDLWEAADQASAGEVVFLRGGVYPFNSTLDLDTSGTADAPITFESYPGELAILDGSALDISDPAYLGVPGAFIRLRRFEVRYMPWQGVYISGTDNLLEGLHVHHSGLSGIQIHGGYEPLPYGAAGSRNTIRDCTIHDNSGAGVFDDEFANGGNSDGVSISSGEANRVEHCLVYANSDDGIDTWRSTNSYVGYSISHSNGIADGNGTGIKAGGASPSSGTTVERCLSYSNTHVGLDHNSGLLVEFDHNTTWDNERGYYGGNDTSISASIAGEGAADFGAGLETMNSWQRPGTLSFVSVDPTSPEFLGPTPGGGFEDIGAFAP